MSFCHISGLVVSAFMLLGGTILTFIGSGAETGWIVLTGVILIVAGLKALTPIAQRGLDWIDSRS